MAYNGGLDALKEMIGSRNPHEERRRAENAFRSFFELPEGIQI